MDFKGSFRPKLFHDSMKIPVAKHLPASPEQKSSPFLCASARHKDRTSQRLQEYLELCELLS